MEPEIAPARMETPDEGAILEKQSHIAGCAVQADGSQPSTDE